MGITNKIVYALHKEDFELLIDTIPDNLDPIVFIEDTKEIWTCGTYFNIGYPSLSVDEELGTVKINIGNSSISLTTSGDSLSIKKGEDNKITISSSALTNISTQSPLLWKDNKLTHETSGIVEGSYGTTSNSDKTNSIPTLYITVNDTGHISEIIEKNVEIRDYVDQLPYDEENSDKSLLLANSSSEEKETALVRKTKGLKYNDSNGVLAVPGGITVIKGDVIITDGYIRGKLYGDVTGSATPKVHLSTKPEYGGASTKLYGHVIISDTVPDQLPAASSDNESTSATNVEAIAASPRMVWDAMEKVKLDMIDNGIVVKALDTSNKELDISKGFTFSDDFNTQDDNIYINWKEI